MFLIDNPGRALVAEWEVLSLEVQAVAGSIFGWDENIFFHVFFNFINCLLHSILGYRQKVISSNSVFSWIIILDEYLQVTVLY